MHDTGPTDTDHHDPVRLAEIDAHTYRRWAAEDASTLLLPVGAFEQHGPHLPLGTDAMLATRIAEAVAAGTQMVVAEPIAYGYKSQQRSGGGDHLPGTISLDAATLIAVTRGVVAQFLRQGIEHLVLVNGHYENYQFLYEGVDLALQDCGVRIGDRQTVLLLSYWDYVSQDTLTEVYPAGFPGWDIEHGGILETSLMLHLAPHLVRMDRAVEHPPAQTPRFDRLPVVPARTPETGCLSSPTGSGADKGRLLFEQVTADLRKDLVTELELPGPQAYARR